MYLYYAVLNHSGRFLSDPLMEQENEGQSSGYLKEKQPLQGIPLWRCWIFRSTTFMLLPKKLACGFELLLHRCVAAWFLTCAGLCSSPPVLVGTAPYLCPLPLSRCHVVSAHREGGRGGEALHLLQEQQALHHGDAHPRPGRCLYPSSSRGCCAGSVCILVPWK